MQIRLGPAGIGGIKEAVNNLNEFYKLGLRAAEIAFTYGVYIKEPDAIIIGKEAKKLDVALSIHAPYFINLASTEKIKIKASIKRILDSCECAEWLGATHVVFHPGYYGKSEKKEIYEIIKNNVLEIQETIKKNKWKVELAPETTGKVNVFGNEEEILKLTEDTGCSFCIDFAHIFARQQGRIDYAEVLDKFKDFRHLHCHFSNINFSDKGERNHIDMDHKPDFKPLAEEILKRKLDITIISETPYTVIGSLKMKNIFEKLGYRFV